MNKLSEKNKSLAVDAHDSINDTYIHTYNTYIHTIEEKRREEKKAHATISIHPSVWQSFQQAVRINNPFSNASDNLEQYMVTFIKHVFLDRSQPKITQFFINKPEQVNIAEKQVISKVERAPLPDFSDMTLEQLEEKYKNAERVHDFARMQTLRFFINKKVRSR